MISGSDMFLGILHNEYNTRSYFNMHSEADISQRNLLHWTKN